MVIGIAGRMRSGKTELAKICEANGYQKLYFALSIIKTVHFRKVKTLF